MATKTKKRILLVVACLMLLPAATVAFAAWRTHAQVEAHIAQAQQAHPHPGDDTAALIEFMHTETHPLHVRNLAAWTLGRLRDPAALPALEEAYTGESCDHDAFLCQYELEKAILRCGGTPHPPRNKNHWLPRPMPP